MTTDFEHLEVDDLLVLAALLFGEPLPLRDVGLLGAAAARSRATAFGADAYPDLWTKAAALMQSIVKSHPLVDGNKRLGWLATATFLELNGVDVTEMPNDDVFSFVMGVAAGRDTVEQIADRLRTLASG